MCVRNTRIYSENHTEAMIELNRIYNEDCLEGMKHIPDGSVDCILTDPPYLYLKNQKLDRPFEEQAFFSECKRVLKKRCVYSLVWQRHFVLSMELHSC